MRKVTFNVIYDRKKVATAKKPSFVEFRFSFCGRSKYMSTGVKVCRNEWKNGEVVGRPDADHLNKLLDSLYQRAEDVVCKMNREGIFNLSQVSTLINGVVKSDGFIAFCEKRTEERNVSEHTKERYRVFCRFLHSWGKIVSFSDINVGIIKMMDEYLHDRGLKNSTIYDYHKFLKLFIRDAVIFGHIKSEDDPYKKYDGKISRGESKYVRCLTPVQFEKLKKLEITSPHLLRAWHLFLFQCYTAMAYSDMMSFDINECERDANGKLFYKNNRVKTKEKFFFQLLKPARDILDLYDGRLPKMSLNKYNDYLKPIGLMIGVDGLRSHMGRATAATMFLSKGMPINIVAKVLGHSGIRQTQRYARTLEDDIKKSFDLIDGKI